MSGISVRYRCTLHGIEECIREKQCVTRVYVVGNAPEVEMRTLSKWDGGSATVTADIRDPVNTSDFALLFAEKC